MLIPRPAAQVVNTVRLALSHSPWHIRLCRWCNRLTGQKRCSCCSTWPRMGPLPLPCCSAGCCLAWTGEHAGILRGTTGVPYMKCWAALLSCGTCYLHGLRMSPMLANTARGGLGFISCWRVRGSVVGLTQRTSVIGFGRPALPFQGVPVSVEQLGHSCWEALGLLWCRVHGSQLHLARAHPLVAWRGSRGIRFAPHLCAAGSKCSVKSGSGSPHWPSQ